MSGSPAFSPGSSMPGANWPPPPTHIPPPVTQPRTMGTNGLAIASLVLGIVGFGVGSLLAVIFGHVALHQIKQRQQSGRGLAIAGLVLGSIAVVSFVVLLLVMAVGGGINSMFQPTHT